MNHFHQLHQHYIHHPHLNVSTEEVVVTTEEVEQALGEVVIHDEPSTSTSRFKPPKRQRSPLPEIQSTGPSIVPSAGGFTGTGKMSTRIIHLIFYESFLKLYSSIGIESITKESAEFSKIVWRKRSLCLHVNQVAFRGDSSLPSSIKELETPMEIFRYFITKEMTDMIAFETNRAPHNVDINTKFTTTGEEINRFIGILIYMSVYNYPNLESYWGKNAFQPIAKTLAKGKFMAIKQYLTFRDESTRVKKGEPGYDALFRIRLLADHLSSRFDSIPKTARLCVDEQMCSTKTKHHVRQYMPNKPHKWGIKLFVLCYTSGFAYRFEIYNGAGDNVVLPGQPDLGATANVVVRLSQTIPEFVHHILYVDNFYTSLPLLVLLRARGIFSLGTVRIPRIPNYKLPNEKDIKDEPRGYSCEYVGSAYGVDIATVVWKDNKLVRLASTYVSVQPFARSQTDPEKQPAKAARYDRKAKGYLEVDCPHIITH